MSTYVTAPQELNVRSGPGVNFPVVRKVYNGNYVDVYESQNGWSNIGDGWINSKFLEEPHIDESD
jgi:uncharacterized protein YgiM (DUF1202 family)